MVFNGISEETEKNKAIKMKWSDYDRNYYCPTCQTLCSCNTEKCKVCNQLLIQPFSFLLNKQSEEIEKID